MLATEEEMAGPPSRVCDCCWINSAVVRLGDPKRSCPSCEAHYNGSGVTIKRDHKSIVERREAEFEARLKAATDGNVERGNLIAELQKEIKGYTDAIASGEVDIELSEHGRREVDQAKALTLQQRARDAYYARDLAMNALTVVVYSKDARILDSVMDIYTKWERRQVDLMQQGRDHGLSRDHPKAVDTGWQWRGRSQVTR